jgi:uncharacterized protein YeaO (DUF488 family)
MDIRVKRIYEEPASDDGQRVLVDRLWPRGISKETAALDAWLKEVAPSDELRTWYHANLDRWEEFHERYLAELEARQEFLDELRDRARRGTVTLLFAAKQTERNHATVLKELLEG